MLRGCLVLALWLCTAPVLARQKPTARSSVERPCWLVPSLHSAAVLLGMRLGASAAWPETYDVLRHRRNGETFRESWSSAPTFDVDQPFFQWDRDPWPINLVGHAVMGSEIYLRHRQGHHPLWLALTMTLAWTVVWEYFVEAWHKHPSGIDLVWSPTGGMLLGEGRFWLHRRILRMRQPTWRHILCYLVDPLGQLERDLLDLDF